MQTPELKVTPKLPVLAFNFEQLKTWATDLAERYASIVVTEEAVADVKRDMAELNKAKKAVDDARKEAVKRVSDPIRTFENQIKEVCGIFDNAYSKLAEQVKTFEDAQREEKRNTVLELIGQCFADAFGARGDWPEFEIPVQEKWLNKTTTLKSIREDVAAIIQRHIEEAQRKAALEQAQKDRAIAIENHVRALNDKHGLNIPVARFLAVGCNPAQPLEETLNGINAVFNHEVAQKAARELAKGGAPKVGWPTPAAIPTPVEQTAPKAEQTAPQAQQTRAMSIVLEYDIAKEAQVKACLETLKPLCVNYGARYRQE